MVAKQCLVSINEVLIKYNKEKAKNILKKAGEIRLSYLKLINDTGS
jgi:hypothetical protein